MDGVPPNQGQLYHDMVETIAAETGLDPRQLVCEALMDVDAQARDYEKLVQDPLYLLWLVYDEFDHSIEYIDISDPITGETERTYVQVLIQLDEYSPTEINRVVDELHRVGREIGLTMTVEILDHDVTIIITASPVEGLNDVAETLGRLDTMDPVFIPRGMEPPHYEACLRQTIDDVIAQIRAYGADVAEALQGVSLRHLIGAIPGYGRYE